MTIHTFTDADRQQRWFRSFEESLQARLEALREKNDKAMSEADTAYLRGQISELKALLGDMKARPPLEIKTGKPVY